MITSLTIENKASNKWYLKIVNLIIGDRISTEIRVVEGVVLKKILYINRKNKIDWELISDCASLQKRSLLCDENIRLDSSYGLKRYKSSLLSTRLCLNMAVAVLKSLEGKSGCDVVFVDMNGEYSGALLKMAGIYDNIKVLTANKAKYEAALEKSMQQNGASFFITDSLSGAVKADLVIAPKKIKKAIPIKNSAILLTGSRPIAEQKGRIFSDYQIRLPDKFAEIKPVELSDIYFASALYDKAKKITLGNITPSSCCDGATIQTPRSIARLLTEA